MNDKIDMLRKKKQTRKAKMRKNDEKWENVILWKQNDCNSEY